MAIAFDSANTDTDANSQAAGVDTLTINHTPAGSNRVLYIFVFLRDGVQAERTPSTITYGGSATGITEITGMTYNPAGGTDATYVYRLLNPATGSNAIVVTMGGLCDHILMHSVSFTGVDQTTPEDGVAGTFTSTAAGTSLTTSRTPTTDNAWRLAGLNISVGSAGIATTGSSDPPTPVLQWSYTTVSGNNMSGAVQYGGPITPAASSTAAWAWTTSREANSNMVVLKPAAASSSNRRVIMVS